MPNDHFTFPTTAFRDTDDDLAQSVNAIHGRALANWLAAALSRQGCTVSEPWPEDHGWDFSITHAGAVYLCACSIDMESPFLNRDPNAKRSARRAGYRQMIPHSFRQENRTGVA